VLYPAYGVGVLNIIIGRAERPHDKLPLPPFTLVAATTRVADLSAPLRSRFSGGVYRLDFIARQILRRLLSARQKILGVKIDTEGVKEIAKRSARRLAQPIYLLKRARDYAQLRREPLSEQSVSAALGMLEVDELWPYSLDRKLLTVLIERFNGGPAGVGALAAALAEEPQRLARSMSRFCCSWFDRAHASRRVATASAYKHVGKTPPHDLNERLYKINTARWDFHRASLSFAPAWD